MNPKLHLLAFSPQNDLTCPITVLITNSHSHVRILTIAHGRIKLSGAYWSQGIWTYTSPSPYHQANPLDLKDVSFNDDVALLFVGIIRWTGIVLLNLVTWTAIIEDVKTSFIMIIAGNHYLWTGFRFGLVITVRRHLYGQILNGWLVANIQH